MEIQVVDGNHTEIFHITNHTEIFYISYHIKGRDPNLQLLQKYKNCKDLKNPTLSSIWIIRITIL